MTTAAPPLPLARVALYLNARGMAVAYPRLLVVRGTGDTVDVTQGKDRMLILTGGAGPGLIKDQAFEQPVVTLRCVGKQGKANDGQDAYDDSEAFAWAVDRWMLSPTTTDIAGIRALYVVRAGGAPTPIMRDAARRVHWSCSYIIPVASGL